jgi:hypothetical protein
VAAERRIEEARRREPWSIGPGARVFQGLPGEDSLAELPTNWSEDGYGLLIPGHETPWQRVEPEGEDDLAREVRGFLDNPPESLGPRGWPVLTSGDPNRRAEYRPAGMKTPPPVALVADRDREMPVYPAAECREDEARADEYELWRRAMIEELYGDPEEQEGNLLRAA